MAVLLVVVVAAVAVVAPEEVWGPDNGQVLSGHPRVLAVLSGEAEVSHQVVESAENDMGIKF